MAMALALATAHAAEKKPSILGATREQVLARLGEPKSQIVAGNREVMFFARERIILRDDVVVEVEAIAAEAPKRTPPPVAPATEPAAATASGTVPAASASSALPAAAPAQPASTAAAAVVAGSGNPPAAAGEPLPATAVAVASAPEPVLEIRLIRPSSAKNRPAPTIAPEMTAPVEPPPAPASAVAGNEPTSDPVASGRGSTAVTTDVATPFAAAVSAPESKSRAPAPDVSRPPSAEMASKPATEAAPPPMEEKPVVTAPTGKKKAKVVRSARRNLDDAEFPDPVESIFTARTYVLSLIVVVAGGGFLVWRHRQRQLELAASAVSRTPFNAPVTPGESVVFAADLLAKLEWKRFEELVTSYYSRTGVVAERTKAGPSSPVHIKIFWKGEPRPFACVRCIAHPTGLIEVAPLQELHALLTAEDIRRGYVVTTGKFGVPARDFAEEKHITLLSGDMLLEKLNALPDATRAELKQEITTGDFTTPSCPKCEAKMVRSSDDPSLWRCAMHADMTIRAN